MEFNNILLVTPSIRIKSMHGKLSVDESKHETIAVEKESFNTAYP